MLQAIDSTVPKEELYFSMTFLKVPDCYNVIMLSSRYQKTMRSGHILETSQRFPCVNVTEGMEYITSPTVSCPRSGNCGLSPKSTKL